MGDLARMFAATTTVPFSPATYDEAFPAWAAGATSVTAETAMAIPAVYACTAVISEDVASVPLEVFERLADGGKRQAPNHPLYELLHDQPNRYQTALEFREMMTAFAILRGKGIAEIIAGPRGPVDQLKPLHPDLVWAETTTEGTLRYRYRDPIKKRERILLPEEVFVVRGKFGRSVLSYAAETFGLALVMQRHASRTYSRGARPSGALKHPKTLKDNARQNLREALDAMAAGGENEGRPLLLEEGMEWQSIALNMKDAEFLATSQWSVPQVSRFFRVSLHKIQELTHATFSNIEHQAVEHVTDTIRPWCERWEQAIRRDLIIAKARFFAEHNLEGILRGDIETRYKAYAIGRQWGWLSQNDIRRRENLNPIGPAGDDYLTPLNMTTEQGQLQFAQPDGRTALYLRAMVRDAAGRAVRKEIAALAKLAERPDGEWRAGVEGFYREHVDFVARLLHVPEETAAEYAASRCAAILGDEPVDEVDVVARLTTIALERSDVLQLAPSGEPAPERIAVTIHQAPVTVAPPAVTIAEGAVQVHNPVTVHEGDVHVAASEPAAVHVDVAAPVVNLPEPRPVRRIAERNEQGQVVITEEPA